MQVITLLHMIGARLPTCLSTWNSNVGLSGHTISSYLLSFGGDISISTLLILWIHACVRSLEVMRESTDEASPLGGAPRRLRPGPSAVTPPGAAAPAPPKGELMHTRVGMQFPGYRVMSVLSLPGPGPGAPMDPYGCTFACSSKQLCPFICMRLPGSCILDVYVRYTWSRVHVCTCTYTRPRTYALDIDLHI